MLHSLHAFMRAGRVAVRAALLAVGSVASVALAAPTVWVTQVSTPAAGTYDRSMALQFTVNFSGPVLVQGSPRLPLRVGDSVRHATFVAPLTVASQPVTMLTFEYAPSPTDRDEDGVTLATMIDLNGGAIVAADRTAAALNFASPDTRGVHVALLPAPTPQILVASAGGTAGDVLTLRGTADGGSRVLVQLVDRGIIGSTQAAANGAWSFDCDRTQIGAGVYQFIASIEDTRGLSSATSAPFVVNVSKRTPDPATVPAFER
jgi:hypothetical protein